MIKREPRVDPLTGESFVPKRRNQRFARPQNRIDYHNERAAEVRDEKHPIDAPLSKNYRIFKGLLAGRTEITIHQEFLLGKGFSPSVITHFEDWNGINTKAVYNYLWTIVPDKNGKPSKFIKIIKYK